MGQCGQLGDVTLGISYGLVNGIGAGFLFIRDDNCLGAAVAGVALLVGAGYAIHHGIECLREYKP
ncbi:MAG: hypothetical protein HYT72_03785 [Candidatus Aenigmarchaeota archaeon]|nr:hypothetical protein [Candidatus Aenigmarchaeota archaeon]